MPTFADMKDILRDGIKTYHERDPFLIGVIEYILESFILVFHMTFLSLKN